MIDMKHKERICMITHNSRSRKTGDGPLSQLMTRLKIRHINVALVCVGLVSAGCSSGTSDVAVAEEQIDDIIKVCKSWDEHWADVEATGAFIENIASLQNFSSGPRPDRSGFESDRSTQTWSDTIER